MPLDLRSVPAEVQNSPEFHRYAAAWKELVESNPLWNYTPHPKQTAFHSARTRVKVFLGGNRSGKSTAGTVDDVIQAVDHEWVPDHLKAYKIWEPPFKCRIVTPDFKRSHAAVIETLRMWCPQGQLRGGSFDSAYEKQEKILWFANGSFIEFMTSEQDLDQFGGSARHRIHFDEEPDGEKGEEIRQECEMRLTDYRGDELFTFTPLNGLGWTFDEFEEEKGPEVSREVWLDQRMVVVRAWTTDNPAIDKEEIAEREARLPEKVREARLQGKFTHFKGLVYEMWDPELHVVPRPSKKHVGGLECWEAIDPGVKTTGVLFGGFDKRNGLLIYDELYLHDADAIPENAAELIRAKREFWGVEPVATLIDPSANNRDLVRQDTVRAAYARAEVSTINAKNDVEGGVFEVMRRLEHETDEVPDPLVVVAENCTHLRKEIGKYRVKETPDGKFAVVKRDDHVADCARYLCAARPTVPPELSRRRSAARKQAWVPGTAPPMDLKPRKAVGPMGSYA
jgi:hypothetical protein